MQGEIKILDPAGLRTSQGLGKWGPPGRRKNWQITGKGRATPMSLSSHHQSVVSDVWGSGWGAYVSNFRYGVQERTSLPLSSPYVRHCGSITPSSIVDAVSLEEELSVFVHNRGIDKYDLQGGRDNLPRYIPGAFNFWGGIFERCFSASMLNDTKKRRKATKTKSTKTNTLRFADFG